MTTYNPKYEVSTPWGDLLFETLKEAMQVVRVMAYNVPGWVHISRIGTFTAWCISEDYDGTRHVDKGTIF